MELNNEYICLLPTKDYSYSKAVAITNQYQVATEKEVLKEIFDFSSTLKLSIAALQS